jgi:hypothetical protein
MKKGLAVRIFCLLAVAGLMPSVVGCLNYNTPERQRRRLYSISEDRNYLSDDVDWMLGWTRPTFAYDELLVED